MRKAAWRALLVLLAATLVLGAREQMTPATGVTGSARVIMATRLSSAGGVSASSAWMPLSGTRSVMTLPGRHGLAALTPDKPWRRVWSGGRFPAMSLVRTATVATWHAPPPAAAIWPNGWSARDGPFPPLTSRAGDRQHREGTDDER